MSFGGNVAALGHTFAPDEIIKNSLANYAFESFEVATYTALITMAEEAGVTDAIPLLKETLAEEQKMQALVAKLHKLADEAGVPLATLAVAWVMANPVITAPLLGASRPDQLAATIAAAEYKIDPALKKQLDEVTAEYRKGDAPR